MFLPVRSTPAVPPLLLCRVWGERDCAEKRRGRGRRSGLVRSHMPSVTGRPPSPSSRGGARRARRRGRRATATPRRWRGVVGGYTNTSGGRRRKGREPPPERCLSRRDLAVHFLDGVDAIRDARRRGLRLLLRRRGRRRRLVDRLAGHALRHRREEGGQLLEQSRLLLGGGYLGRVRAGRRGRFGGRLGLCFGL